MSSSPAFDFLWGAEKLYKADIATVLLYLAEEATSNGVPIPIRVNVAADTRDENPYVVTTNDIVPFASRVITATQRRTPTVILSTLGRTIRSRKRCNVWYQGQPINDASLASSNRSHQQFDSVLDKLFNVLDQNHIHERADDSREQLEAIMTTINSNLAGTSASATVELENWNIAWHELDQDAFERYRSPRSVPAPENESQMRKKPEPPADYQVEEPTYDTRFALFNLFKDLDRIRQHVHRLLEKYVSGNVGLVLIGAVINSAIGIVRSMETKFLRSLPQPRFTSWEDVMSIIASPPHFQAMSKGLSEGPELDFLCSIYGLPFQQLQQFRDSMKAKTFPTVDHVDFVDPKPSCPGSGLRQMTILNEYLQEVALLGGGETLASKDELTRGIIDILFGLQLFLDTQERLGSTLGLTSQGVTATADVYSFVEPHVQYSPDTEKVTFPGASWIDRDEFLKLRRLGRIKISKIPRPFLPQIPVVCGNLQCGIFAKLQSDKITKYKRSPLGTAAACLYNAVRNEGYLDLQWQEMELLIENYDSAEVFEGQPPNDAKEYYNHFVMSIDSYHIKGFGRKRESQVSQIVKTFEKLLCQVDPSKTEMSIDLVEENA
ncbi:hypothetical protein BDR22DRAFT_548977 [Usnea florida]